MLKFVIALQKHSSAPARARMPYHCQSSATALSKHCQSCCHFTNICNSIVKARVCVGAVRQLTQHYCSTVIALSKHCQNCSHRTSIRNCTIPVHAQSCFVLAQHCHSTVTVKAGYSSYTVLQYAFGDLFSTYMPYITEAF